MSIISLYQCLKIVLLTLAVLFVVEMLASADEMLQDATTKAETIMTSVAITPSLRFLLLGDWGKGGVSGTYGSVLVEDGKIIERLELTEAMEDQSMRDLGSLSQLHLEGKTLYQVAVASAMGAFVKSSVVIPSFLIALGDNFYDSGVPSADSILWQYLWKDVYLSYQGLRIPWYLAIMIM